MESEVVLIYLTIGDREKALTLARALVRERLLACANVVPGITSVYEWQGKICEEGEALLVGKTTRARLDALKARVQALHDYECPCLVALSVTDGLPPFLAWVAEMTDNRRPESE